MIRVTIVLSVYNAEDTIEECVQSLLDQTYPSIKILILDDVSTDNTIARIEKFQSDKIELIKLKTKGYVRALNIGLERSKSDYVARMDADDVMLPTKIEEQVQFMDANPHIVASGTYVRTFGSYEKTWTRFRPGVNQQRRNIFWFSSMNHPSSIIRNSVLKKYNIRYDENFDLAEDFKFWVDLLKVGDISNIPKPLMRYRIHDKQVSVSQNTVQYLVANGVRRSSIKDFLNECGLEIETFDKYTDKVALFHQISSLKVATCDQWHLAMTRYMLIQSTSELRFWRFLKVLFTSRFVFDRNSTELIIKMMKTKAGADEKPML